jgi:hypothetical protein
MSFFGWSSRGIYDNTRKQISDRERGISPTRASMEKRRVIQRDVDKKLEEEIKWHSPIEKAKRDIEAHKIIERQAREAKEALERKKEEQNRLLNSQSQEGYKKMVEHQRKFNQLRENNSEKTYKYFSLEPTEPSRRSGGRILKNNNKKPKKISEKVKKPKKVF